MLPFSPVFINKIESAHPPYEFHQTMCDVIHSMIPADSELKPKLARVIAKLGIEKRYSVLKKTLDLHNTADGFYKPGSFPTTGERMSVYMEKALPLAALALEPLLAGENPQSITHLIVTSCTGFYAPGVDIDIMKRFGLRNDVSRTLIGFMGCYAAVPAMRQAFHIVRSQPKAKVLMVNLEICSLHFRENVPLDQLLSFLLFADGTAASLISSEEQGLRLDSFYSAIIPDSLDLMRWTISDQGFYMNLDEKIPAAIKECLHKDSSQVLQGIPQDQISSWAIHPGGRAILDAVQSALNLEDSALRFSRSTLKDFGNVSSATIMFVLKAILQDNTIHGPGCGMAFGPGLALESFLYSKK